MKPEQIREGKMYLAKRDERGALVAKVLKINTATKAKMDDVLVSVKWFMANTAWLEQNRYDELLEIPACAIGAPTTIHLDTFAMLVTEEAPS